LLPAQVQTQDAAGSAGHCHRQLWHWGSSKRVLQGHQEIAKVHAELEQKIGSLPLLTGIQGPLLSLTLLQIAKLTSNRDQIQQDVGQAHIDQRLYRSTAEGLINSTCLLPSQYRCSNGWYRSMLIDCANPI
jgi:hypothetical protein